MEMISFDDAFEEVNDMTLGDLTDRMKDIMRRSWRWKCAEYHKGKKEKNEKFLPRDEGISFLKESLVAYLQDKECNIKVKIGKYNDKLSFISDIIKQLE